MALTFQEIKDSYENSDLHIHVIKLPVPLTLKQAEFSLLNVDYLWPDPDQEYAKFDFAYVAECDIEHATSSANVFSKGFFISKPGADDFVCLNDMTDSDKTATISSVLLYNVTAIFCKKDSTVIPSSSQMSVLNLLKYYFSYDCGISSYEICEYSHLAFNSSKMCYAYSREKQKNIYVHDAFACTPIHNVEWANQSHSYAYYIIDDCDTIRDINGNKKFVLKESVHICPDCNRKYIYVDDYKNKCYHCYCITADTNELILKADAYHDIDNDMYYKTKPVEKICPCCGSTFIEGGHTYMKDTANITICDDCNHELDERLSYEEQHYNGIVGIISNYHSNNTKQHLYGLLKGQSATDFKGFGFELEVDKSIVNGSYMSLYNNLVAHAIIDNTGLEKDEVFFETDGSLENGFEIISQPHTIAAFYEKTDSWKMMLDILSDATFKSHNAGTCGLHIHVSKTWFGSTERQQNFHIGKIYKFFDAYWTDLVKASRRDTGSTYYCDKNKTNVKYREEIIRHKTESHAWQAQAKYDHDTRHDSESHHHALNNSNYNTFEIRLGRGTLNNASFFAWIDIVLNIVKNSSKRCHKLISARDWLDGIKPSTAMYLLKRKSFADAIKILHNDVYELYNNQTDSQD